MAINKDLSELGRSGLNHQSGYVFEEKLPELSGFNYRRVIRQMRDNDAVINSILFAIEMLVRRVTWTVTPASDKRDDQKQADFFRRALFEDMSQSWPDTVAEILTMLPWGWCWLETVYKERLGDSADPSRRSRFSDGRIGWRKWAIRAQESLEKWEFDEGGGVQAMVQAPPPDYRRRIIPIDKSLHFRTTHNKGNPEGRSIMRGAYRSYYFKSRIENIEGVGIERDLAGYPVMYVPNEILSSTASDEDKQIRQHCESIVTGIKRDELEGSLMPGDRDDKGEREFELELLTTGGQRQFDTDRIIQRYDQRIAICVLADFVLLGHTQKAGSYGMTDKKSELFCTAGDAWLDSICAVINRHAIPRLQRLNGMRTENSPQLAHGGMERVSLKELGEYVNALSGANITFEPVEQEFLKQQIKGLPVVPAEEVKPGRKDTEHDNRSVGDGGSEE